MNRNTEVESRQRSCFNGSPLKRSKLLTINKLASWKAECLRKLFRSDEGGK